jgi:hypothetical protein
MCGLPSAPRKKKIKKQRATHVQRVARVLVHSVAIHARQHCDEGQQEAHHRQGAEHTLPAHNEQWVERDAAPSAHEVVFKRELACLHGLGQDDEGHAHRHFGRRHDSGARPLTRQERRGADGGDADHARGQARGVQAVEAPPEEGDGEQGGEQHFRAPHHLVDGCLCGQDDGRWVGG